MKKELEKDLFKLTKSVGLYLAILVGTVISILNSISFYKMHKAGSSSFQNTSGYNYPDVLILGWLGGNVNAHYIDLIMFLLPLISVMPYGWCLYKNYGENRIDDIIFCFGYKKIISKYIIAFMSGGFVCALPFIISLMVSAWYLPNLPVEPVMMQSFITNVDIMSEIYYSYPLLYMLVYILLIFVFGGLFATMSLNVSCLSGNVGLVLLFPITVSAFFRAVAAETEYAGMLPENFLNPCQKTDASIAAIWIIMILLILWNICMIYVYGRESNNDKNENIKNKLSDGKRKRSTIIGISYFGGIIIIATIIRQHNVKSEFLIENHVGNIDTIIESGSYEIHISEPVMFGYDEYFDMLSERYECEKVENLWEYGWIEGYDSKIIQVHVTLTKIKEDNSVFDLTDLVLYQNAYFRMPDNDILYLMGERSPTISLQSGEYKEVVLAYCMYSDGFSEKDWERLDELEYEITSAVYPKRLGVKFRVSY